MIKLAEKHATGLWLGALAATLIVYYPALSSGFLLDDANNLAGLTKIPDSGFLQYIFGGTAGPGGRPLSLLTFAMQYPSWPDNPFAFKFVNLLLHIGCGMLLYAICRMFADCLHLQKTEKQWFSLLVSAFWLLHPLHLTTVLYPVQRMTQLAALFMLLGVWCYLYFRLQYRANRDPKILLYMGAAVWGCLLLAVASKENGILLPLLLLVIHGTLFAGEKTDRALRLWHWLVAGLPLLALLVYLVVTFDAVVAGYQSRSFTMPERLLTQAVVVSDYLRVLLFPLPADFSLYHDDFPVSHGLLSPPWTLLCLVLITGLLLAAVLLRKQQPLLALGIFWFFAGHLLESTYLNLELYFEHRNYLPSIGILVLLGFVLISMQAQVRRLKILYGILGLYGLLVVGNTVYQVGLWVEPLRHHQFIVEHHPESERAWVALINKHIAAGGSGEAETFTRQLASKYPQDIYPELKLLAIDGCVRDREIAENEWQQILIRAGQVQTAGFGTLEELSVIISAVTADECQGINPVFLTRLVVTLALNPELRQLRSKLHAMAARLGVYIGDAGVAYHNSEAAVQYEPSIAHRILNLRILIALEREQDAMKAMTRLQEQVDANPRYRIAYAGTITELQRLLQKND